MINIKRVQNLKKGLPRIGPVVYWMSRDQRVHDNWALVYAVELAENNRQPVMVIFNLADNYPGATWRQYDFMIKGLQKAENHLKELHIPFHIFRGDPVINISRFIKFAGAANLVMDFDPLRIKLEWQSKITSLVDACVDVVDAHNIVPCFEVSDKEEYAASTFRPKISRLLPEFLDNYPPLLRQNINGSLQHVHWHAVTASLKTDHSVKPANWIVPGEKGAKAAFERFVDHGLDTYGTAKNNPNADCTSRLSAYLHFGHISAQRIALELLKEFPSSVHVQTFLEEIIIRKELADNFCYYNPAYDTTSAFRTWAKTSLDAHVSDNRSFIYTKEQLENAVTHDSLWNAAQSEMIKTGFMHGYLRMYWAKKILEWTSTPEEALQIANYLNDKYQLDGRDPNGYTGTAWSIGGVHDRPWGEREIFGKIRYMNRSGCERKFDVDLYIQRIHQIGKSL